MKAKKKQKNKKQPKVLEEQKRVEQNKQRSEDNQVEIGEKTVESQQKQTNNPSHEYPNLINKQQSLDIYMQLKLQEHKKQSQVQQLLANSQELQNMKNEHKKTGLIYLQDSDTIAPINLESSPRTRQTIQIQLISYRTTTFMAMTTQIFTLKINDPNSGIFYQIQRRFSNFADLYEHLFYNHPGYILPPFPDSTLQSFLKVKMGLSVQSGQKSEIVEKRMRQLELFLRQISAHNELCNSQQFLTFIKSNQKQFEEGTVRLNKYVQEFKALENGSQLKLIFNASKTLISSYLTANNQLTNQSSSIIDLGHQYTNLKVAEYGEQIRILKQKISIMFSQAKQLIFAQKYFAQFDGMETQNDSLQKLCAKIVSCRNFSNDLYQFLITKFLEESNLLLRLLEQSQRCLIHIAEIVDKITLSKKQSNEQKKAKLERRLERAQRNFELDWPSLCESLKKRTNTLSQNFSYQWLKYKSQMKRVWKPLK